MELNRVDEKHIFLHNMKIGMFSLLKLMVKRAIATNANFNLCKDWSFVTNYMNTMESGFGSFGILQYMM